jgi:DNA-binding transcriptional MerR regulator
MKIGELAERAGVSTKTIRYYEGIGLLPPPDRTSSNYRDYGDDAVERLRFVRDSQVAGLTLAEVGSILEMKDAGQSTCAHTKALLHRHLEEIDEQIEALKAARKEMATLAERADSMDPGECSDPHRCQVIAAAQEGAHHPGHRTRLPLHVNP